MLDIISPILHTKSLEEATNNTYSLPDPHKNAHRHYIGNGLQWDNSTNMLTICYKTTDKDKLVDSIKPRF